MQPCSNACGARSSGSTPCASLMRLTMMQQRVWCPLVWISALRVVDASDDDAATCVVLARPDQPHDENREPMSAVSCWRTSSTMRALHA